MNSSPAPSLNMCVTGGEQTIERPVKKRRASSVIQNVQTKNDAHQQMPKNLLSHGIT